MKVKINNRPILVKDPRDEKPVNKPFVLAYGLGGLLCLSLLDYIGFIFAGFHPFPWITWLGRFLIWLVG